MTNGFLIKNIGSDDYTCMICRRNHPSALLMRRCLHGVKKETKVIPTDVKETQSNNTIPFNNLDMMRSKIEGFDLDKLKKMGKDFNIPHAAVKGKVKLVNEIMDYLKQKGEF